MRLQLAETGLDQRDVAAERGTQRRARGVELEALLEAPVVQALMSGSA
jgi:hypothetical protein